MPYEGPGERASASDWKVREVQGATHGMCGFPGCELPERHPGDHKVATIEHKRERAPSKLARDLGAK